MTCWRTTFSEREDPAACGFATSASAGDVGRGDVDTDVGVVVRRMSVTVAAVSLPFLVEAWPVVGGFVTLACDPNERVDWPPERRVDAACRREGGIAVLLDIWSNGIKDGGVG